MVCGGSRQRGRRWHARRRGRDAGRRRTPGPLAPAPRGVEPAPERHPHYTTSCVAAPTSFTTGSLRGEGEALRARVRSHKHSRRVGALTLSCVLVPSAPSARQRCGVALLLSGPLEAKHNPNHVECAFPPASTGGMPLGGTEAKHSRDYSTSWCSRNGLFHYVQEKFAGRTHRGAARHQTSPGRGPGGANAARIAGRSALTLLRVGRVLRRLARTSAPRSAAGAASAGGGLRSGPALGRRAAAPRPPCRRHL